MTLSNIQKSVYLTILNATMVLRSIGKTLHSSVKLRKFKRRLFNKLDKLAGLLNTNKLTDSIILKSIETIANEFKISYGQSQKAINVILKYHFYLTNNASLKMKKVLHCPIDSLILHKELDIYGLSLTKIDKDKYIKIQKEIESKYKTKIECDAAWDEEKLKQWGL